MTNDTGTGETERLRQENTQLREQITQLRDTITLLSDKIDKLASKPQTQSPSTPGGLTIIIGILGVAVIALIVLIVYLLRAPRGQAQPALREQMSQPVLSTPPRSFAVTTPPASLQPAVEYVRRQQSRGIDDASIKQMLVAEGWSAEKVDAIFHHV